MILAIANIWLVPEHGLIDRLIGALIVSVPMLLLALVIPGAFGGGDIKLMAVSGAFLGTGPVVCAMFFGLLTGGAYGAFMLKSKEIRKKRCICIWTISCIRTGAGGIIWRSDRYMVSAFFIKRVMNSY